MRHLLHSARDRDLLERALAGSDLHASSGTLHGDPDCPARQDDPTALTLAALQEAVDGQWVLCDLRCGPQDLLCDLSLAVNCRALERPIKDYLTARSLHSAFALLNVLQTWPAPDPHALIAAAASAPDPHALGLAGIGATLSDLVEQARGPRTEPQSVLLAMTTRPLGRWSMRMKLALSPHLVNSRGPELPFLAEVTPSLAAAALEYNRDAETYELAAPLTTVQRELLSDLWNPERTLSAQVAATLAATT